ncbi:thioredoxin [Mariniphaga sediminis]|jgi:thiol-disulfide isomerase/thioredoxin|uniref:Thioredoxin n=1 Tax=Mariniphaga sediminis TaxID=1628158 RepID=A0A399D5Q2_9BACT|nr:thioredoxin family protein [Mariniphaga sediminis]RIH67214.1 thioredoxin [Mariniphaga sediminis]
MFAEIKSLEEFNKLKEEEPALLGYFSTDTCSVCKVLKPKVEELVRDEFPRIKPVYVRLDILPEIAGQQQVFTAPTILVFFDGRETIRKSRNIGIEELRKNIDRPYSLIFGD